MSNPLIAKYNTAGTYIIKVESGLYRLTLVGGGGNAYYATTGDADGGYAYTRGWGGGSGGAFSGIISLPKGTYTVVIGGVAGSSYITDSTGETVLSVGGGGNAAKWAVGIAGTAPTVNPNYNVLETTINKAGNAGLTAKGDWGGGYGTGGGSVYSSYGTGASINSGGSWGRTDGGFELLTYTASRHNKFYAQEKRVFDIDKVTVVGNSTITSDGIASGFSSGTYINTIFNEKTPNNEVKFKIRFTPKKNPSETERIVSSTTDGNTFLAFYANNSISFRFQETSIMPNITLKEGNFILGEYIDVEFIATKTSAIIKTTTQSGYTYTKTLGIALSSFKPLSSFQFGNGGTFNGNYFTTGSIDLKEFKIYVDGQLVFQPTKPTYLLERRKEGYDPSKFTIVGSPTITEYGVASGFSSGLNYVETSTAIDFSKPFEIYSSFQLDDITSSACVLWKILGSDYNNNLVVRPSSNVINIALRINNTIVPVGVSNFSFVANLIYNTVLGWDGAKYYLKIKAENETNWKESSILSDLPIDVSSNRQIVTIGKMPSEQNINFTGSINLPSISITVDGKEVFTGAKENYYMLRR